MDKRTGIITYEQYSMLATVYYQKPQQFQLGEWHGFGQVEEGWPIDLLGQELETNIGTIIITNYDGKKLNFKGSGPLKGPAVEEIGY